MIREQEDQNDTEHDRDRRIQNESALALANESFDLIFEDATVMMHSIDGEGKLLRVNRRWVETLGYDSDEVVGHKSIDFLTDESRMQAVEDTLPLFWRSGAARSVGYQFVKKDGGLLNVLMDAEATHAPNGDALTLAALRDSVDTSQRRQATATIRALKEIANIQLELEATASSDGSHPPSEPASHPLPWPDFEHEPPPPGLLMVDLEFHRITVDRRPVRLTAKEWAILRILVNSAGRVVSPRRLLTEAWGPEYIGEVDYVRSYIRRLRKKLEPDPQHPRYILSERGLGYRLELGDSDGSPAGPHAEA